MYTHNKKRRSPFMKDRIVIVGSSAILKLIAGTKDGPSSGLILHGAEQCFELAELLIQAGERIGDNKEYNVMAPNTFSSNKKAKKFAH
jgi:hypothetical protein